MEKYYIDARKKKTQIPSEIYGNFSEHLGRCVYEGIYVGENADIPNTNGIRNDVAAALRHIRLPVLRWPGGCFADEYHWRDGVGPKSERKKILNSLWGGVVDNNHFGTHEFFELCRQVGCKAYVNANVGSGTVREMQEWVEYMTAVGTPQAEQRRQNGDVDPWRLSYIGIGNENWGGGGNMTAEYYANEYRRYQTFVKNYNGNKVYKIACGPNADDFQWTQTLMKNAARFMDGLSLHYYVVPGDWAHKGSATDFTEEEYYTTLRKALLMEELIIRHGKIMDQYDPEKRIGLIVDEWGVWYDVEPGTNPGFLYQQNTMRDALVAGVTLNIFNRHTDRVRMANIAQLANVLQSVILTEGPKMILTPTYHIFDMYKKHINNTLIDGFLDAKQIETAEGRIPMLSESASTDEEGHIFATVCNLSLDETADIAVELAGASVNSVEAQVLTGDAHAHNTFENSDAVRLHSFTDYRLSNGGLTLRLPPCSVIGVTFA